MTGSSTIWHRLKITPPPLMRLLARKRHGRPLTSREIADRSGMTVAFVDFVSEQQDWESLSMKTLKDFMVGCDLDIFARGPWRRIENYLAGTKVNGKRFAPTFRYLKIDPKWDSYFRPLLASWLKNKGKA